MGKKAVSTGRILVDNFEELLATLLLIAIGSSMAVQVVARGIFNNPLGWPEMLSQMLLIWASVLGAVGAAKRSDLIRMESLLVRLPGRARGFAEWMGTAAVLVLLAVLAWKGLQLAQRTSTVAHPLPVTWAWGYSAAPAFSVLMAIRLIQMNVFAYRFSFVETALGASMPPSEFGALSADEPK